MNKYRFTVRFAITALAALAFLATECVAAVQNTPDIPTTFSLPSSVTTGNSYSDKIWVNYYSARVHMEQTSPGIVVIPPLGSDKRDPLIRQFARYLASRGFNCAVMDLPAHGQRRLNGQVPAIVYAGSDIHTTVIAFQQGAADVSTVAAWLRKQPEVDPNKIGVVGISLGAIVTHLAMGLDASLSAGVAIIGGGDMGDLYRHGAVSLVLRRKHPNLPRPDDLDISELTRVDPITYAGNNRPRHVLMIEAARDLFIPPSDSEELWHSLGKPPIQWVDTNHFGSLLFPETSFKAAAAYLTANWSGQPVDAGALPKAYAPTIKTGILYGMNMGITPAIQWQFYSFASRPDHISLLNANLGLSFHGPFAGVALTVNQFVDIGMGSRLGRYDPKPYISMHIVF